MWNGSADKTELQVDFAMFGRGFWGHDLQTMDIFISILYVNLLEGLVVRNLHQSFCSHLADMPLSAELRHKMLALVKLQGSPPSAKWDPRVDTKFRKLRARFFPNSSMSPPSPSHSTSAPVSGVVKIIHNTAPNRPQLPTIENDLTTENLPCRCWNLLQTCNYHCIHKLTEIMYLCVVPGCGME